MRLRLISIALIVVLCMALQGCRNNSETPEDVPGSEGTSTSAEFSGELFLPYTPSDSLNPYTAETKINRELSTLLYDSLIVLDENMQPQYRLAESVAVEGVNCVIKLKEATFSDGTNVTAEDVTSSIKAALASPYKYKDQLSNVASYNAADSKTVTITLHTPDAYFASMLDFPIYKMNTENLKNEDNKALPPTGSGRYVYSSDGGEVSLLARSGWIGGEVSVGKITLIDAPDSDALQHNIESSSISMYYTDLSDESVPGWSESLMKSPLTNMVFIGVNSSRQTLQSANMRKAISSAVNRQAIVEDAFYSYAEAATGLYHPYFYATKDAQHINTVSDDVVAAAEFAAAGYSEKNNDGYFTLNGEAIKLEVLVNSENSSRMYAAEAVKNSLRRAGVQAEVVSVSAEEYNARITSGNFDLYIGEVKLPKNFDMSAFFTDGAAASYGIDAASPTKAKYAEYKAGTASISDFIAVFESDMPIIPLVYRCGLLCYTSSLPTQPISTISDIYYNIQAYAKS